ncbi:hypothetical protein ACIA58_05775 [Kribbella sp. NPDC051586]|uniref:hypothetical protein n=1 Tax=Kribbella sp. NPDC051586 TaxID=3364118 RepID=UPI0037B83960
MSATIAAAVVQPIVVLSVPCDASVCDAHGYFTIFATVPAAGVVVVALVALVLLVISRRAGFGAALGAAAACAALLFWNGDYVPGGVRWPIAALTAVVAVLAFAGLRLAPDRARRQQPGLEEPPYPSLG